MTIYLIYQVDYWEGSGKWESKTIPRGYVTSLESAKAVCEKAMFPYAEKWDYTDEKEGELGVRWSPFAWGYKKLEELKSV